MLQIFIEMKVLSSILIGILIVTSLQGQDFYVLNGAVTDSKGRSLVGVNVFEEGSKTGTVTNMNGEFSMKLAAGKHVLRFTSVGFESFTQVIEMPVATSLEVILKEGLYELPEIIVERETMTGGSLYVKDVPGAAHYIGLPELQKFKYTDINRILRNIPGVNIQEEDGFGLRPNIGMRGSGVERSSKITMMEDGILVAPAPYTAPAAYYFPTAGRMSGVEVRKGSSQIKYGPYTVGGAINFLSTPIPQEFAANVSMMGGTFGRRTVQASIGQSFKYGGFVVETFQNQADGFKDLDNGGPTGFINQDYIAKVRFNTAADAKIYQAVTFKIGQTTGDSDETYLGLTESDFNATPNRRYFGSQVDNIQTEQHQYSVKYNIIPTQFMDISITGYRTDFKRNWYKLDQVKYDTQAKVGISAILDDPITYKNQYDLLTGTTSPNADALFVRNNNREYFSEGVQGIVGMNFSSNEIEHDIEIGFRFHRDQEDRYQWDDAYAMENGVMKLTTKGTPGTESNRISEAEAFASYVQYTLQYGKFKAIPGIRYEKMTFTRDDYGKADPERLGTALKQTENKVDVWIPGIGLEYAFNPSFSGFAGIHKGFAPPGATEGTSPEKAINYEIGGRATKNIFNIQTVIFYNDYANLLGSDLAAAGGGGTGDQFNAGEAVIYGAEIELGVLFSGSNNNWSIPMNVAYTLTHGEFHSSFQATNEDWGKVNEGDEIPYIATHQLVYNVGINHTKYSVNLSSKFNSPMRTAPGTGEIPANEMIDRNLVFDIAANYNATRYLSFFGSITNLFDEVYVVARRPAGLRPGMPRAFQLGLKVNL